MSKPNDPIRDHLARLLEWEEAHVGFDQAVAGVPAHARGECPRGFEHSPWQLLEHLRIAQDDLLDFCLNAKYEHNRAWPDDYWPKEKAPEDDAAWSFSIAECTRSRRQLQQLTREVDDLTAKVPTGNPNQTYLRAILIAADHVAYHLGQLVAVRRALGVWS
ncbi:MAG: DinB family protein [Vicinamibacteria bacterium]